MANEDVAWGYELENYINIGTPEAPKWVKATELLSWEQSGESKTYEPAWIDRKTPPTLTYGRSCSINMEKDTVRDGELDEWIFKHRNDLDEAWSEGTWDASAKAFAPAGQAPSVPEAGPQG